MVFRPAVESACSPPWTRVHGEGSFALHARPSSTFSFPIPVSNSPTGLLCKGVPYFVLAIVFTVVAAVLLECKRSTSWGLGHAYSPPPPCPVCPLRPSSPPPAPHGMPTTKTVSWCVPQTEQGAHVFVICGYSQHRGIGINESLISGVFSIGGNDWRLRFYPDGLSPGEDGVETFQDCAAVGLKLVSKNVNVRASYEVRLLEQGTGMPVSLCKVAPKVFNSGGYKDMNWLSLSTAKRSIFDSPTYLWHDQLAIECVLNVFKQPSVSETKPFPRIMALPSDMTKQFAKLLETKEGADVNFSVGGIDFAAHRTVLATRSPVFKAELYGPMSEGGTEPIVVKDVQPDVFRALLHFIYTDWLPSFGDLYKDDCTEMIRHLLVAADRYAMERLKLMCQSILCENLHAQTLATTLALADQHHCDKLKDACIEFMSSSGVMNAVEATQAYKNLKRTSPSVAFEALEKVIRFRKA